MQKQRSAYDDARDFILRDGAGFTLAHAEIERRRYTSRSKSTSAGYWDLIKMQARRELTRLGDLEQRQRDRMESWVSAASLRYEKCAGDHSGDVAWTAVMAMLEAEKKAADDDYARCDYHQMHQAYTHMDILEKFLEELDNRCFAGNSYTARRIHALAG